MVHCRHTNHPQELPSSVQHGPGLECILIQLQGSLVLAEPFKDPPQVTSLYWRTKGNTAQITKEKQTAAPRTSGQAGAQSQASRFSLPSSTARKGPAGSCLLPPTPSPGLLTVSHAGPWVTHTSTPWVSLGSSPNGVARWWDHGTWQSPLFQKHLLSKWIKKELNGLYLTGCAIFGKGHGSHTQLLLLF